jgi:lysozyme
MGLRQINARGLNLIKKWEGIKDGNPSTVNLDPYLDDVGVWTIGWGHAILDASGHMVRGAEKKAIAYALYPDGLTFNQADALLIADSLEASKDVGALVPATVTDNQFSALVSFEYNLGALAGSTLLKRLKAGDWLGAADQFGKWVKGRVDGQLVTLPGLVSRRADERALFLSVG